MDKTMLRYQKSRGLTFVLAAVLAGTACAAYADVAYEHRGWRRYGNMTKNATEIQFDKDRYVLYKFPQEGFAFKYAQPWTLIHDDGWLVNFKTDVRGGLKISDLPSDKKLTLDAIVSKRIEEIRREVESEGGKLISVLTSPATFCGLKAKKIEQKFTFSDVKQALICKTYISVGKGKIYRLDLAAPEYLYKDKDYSVMLNESASSAKLMAIGVRTNDPGVPAQEIEKIVSEAIASLKQIQDKAHKIVYKYPSNWQIRKPYELAAAEVVILFDSPKDLIHGAITCEQVFPGQTLDSLARKIAGPLRPAFGKWDSELVKNEPCKFGGQPGRLVITRGANHYLMSDPWRLSVSYLAVVGAKVYEFNINAPEAAFAKVQRLVDALLPSIKIE